MENKAPFRYFLGANSRYGFHSLYGGFCPPGDGRFLHVIKGGPGCGKSSFMRKIASAAREKGLEVEEVLCSGDPDSLDGIYIPSLKTGYVDGTAPHIIEAVCPGASSAYLDLGRFYNFRALSKTADEIGNLGREYSGLYRRAYGEIAAGAALMPRHFSGQLSIAHEEKLRRKAAGFAAREFCPAATHRGPEQCFLSALSCQGLYLPADMLAECGMRLCYIDNELGLGNAFLQILLEHARSAGIRATVCRDCVDPELIEALIFPGLQLALICGDGRRCPEELYRHMRLDAMAQLSPDEKSDVRRARRLSAQCFQRAVETLGSAKALHDRLETLYNPFVDFDGVYEEAERHISILL